MPPTTLFIDALLAYCVHEHQLGHVKRIAVRLQPQSATVEDDGRGMGLDRDGYVESLMGLFTEGNAHPVQLHGVGLSMVAACTPRLVVESRRGERSWRQSFVHGVAEAPPEVTADGPSIGTRITLALAQVDAESVRAAARRWLAAHPGLAIEVA